MSLPRTQVVETSPLKIDRVYTSMTGPFERADVDVSGLDWITALRTEVIDVETGDPMGGEFFCHSQLQQENATRLMVMATGMDEIRFPQGFAMPASQILSHLPESERSLKLLGMVLNNHERDIDRLAKIRATIEYLTNEDLRSVSPPKKLYKIGLTLEVRDLKEYVPEEGLSVPDDVTTHCVLVSNYLGHWVVPPGTQKTRMRFSGFIPVDGTVHYVNSHLHNYGVYLRLTDVTTGELLWQTDAEYEEDRVQIARIPAYSSMEGFSIYKDHVYELEAFYNNTTDRDVDAMAMMYLYYHPSVDIDIYYPKSPHIGASGGESS